MAGCSTRLPSRELIADAVEYMVEAHCADALVCISNCDKITPGMLMAAMRLNVPTVFVSGGPMEAGKVVRNGTTTRADLITAMVAGADAGVTDAESEVIERSACPTCGSVLGDVHRELDELPDRGAGAWRCPATARRSPPTPIAAGCSSRRAG